MIKNKITVISDRIDDRLQSLSDRISPDGRILIVLILLFVFGAGSIYITVSSIYNMGKRSGREMQIEHIKSLEPEYQQKTDSINQLNRFDYE